MNEEKTMSEELAEKVDRDLNVGSVSMLIPTLALFLLPPCPASEG